MQNQRTKEPDRDRAVAFLIRLLLRIQTKWVSWMERKTGNISPGTWYILLLLFIVVSMSLNAWLIYDGLTDRDQQEISITAVKRTGYPTYGEKEKKDDLSKNSSMDSITLKQE